jgi:hypothetical protein
MDGHANATNATGLDGRQLLALEARRMAGEAEHDRLKRITKTLNQSWDFLRRCNALPDLDREVDRPHVDDSAV